MKKLLGSVEPRIFTPPLRKLTKTSSLGFEVIDWVEGTLGETLYPHQKWLLIHALETMPRTHKLRFRHVLTLMARRNSKTHTLNMLSAYRLANGPSQIRASSSQRDTARETFLDLATLIEDHSDLFPRVKPRTANGQEEISFRPQKSRYKIVATNRKGGRGQAARLAIEDELREHDTWEAHAALSPTINTLPDGQLWMASNAGDRTSVVLNTFRAQALEDIKKDNTKTQMFFAEWSAPDGCEIDDRNGWAAANPLMNRLWEENVLEVALNIPAAQFRTEHLSQFVPSLDEIVSEAAWSGCLDPVAFSEEAKGRVAVCFDISPDLRHASLVAAASLPDGRVRVETLGQWESTTDVRAELPGLLTKVRPLKTAWFSAGPAAALSTDLKKISRNVELTGSEVTAACQELAELVQGGRIAHNGDELLAGHILGARKLTSGDGWRFDRKDGGYCDAAYAMAGAVKLARTISPRTSFKLITADK